MVWMRSALLILPGFMPNFFAFFFTSSIFIIILPFFAENQKFMGYFYLSSKSFISEQQNLKKFVLVSPAACNRGFVAARGRGTAVEN
jgi:hypothetical protein